MSVFTYKGRDANGKKCTGWTEADSPKSARATLAEQGILTTSLTESSALLRKISAQTRSSLYNELGVLLSSGFNLEQAATLLINETSNDTLASILPVLREAIRNGASLSAAISQTAIDIPSFEKSALETAENSGLQGQMLVTLSKFLDAEAATKDKIKSALTYPLAVLALATGLLSLMVYVILPKAAEMFMQFGDSLPAGSRALAAWAPKVMTVLFVIAALTAVTVVRIRKKAKSDIATAVRLEKFQLSVPFLKKLQPQLWAMRFAGTMSLLMKAGVAPQSAIEVSGAATGSAWTAALAKEAAENVKNGEPLSKAITEISPVSRLLAEWIRIGETSGNLREMLEQASARCRQSYETSLAKLLGVFEPALIVAVGVVVLLIALTVIRPMLELAKAAAG